MCKGTGPKEIYLYQNPQAVLKNQISTFDEADIQTAYACAHGKDDETVTIISR